MNLIPQPCVIPQTSDRIAHIGLSSDTDAFTRVERLEFGEDLGVSFD
jgi:hypothetical protein